MIDTAAGSDRYRLSPNRCQSVTHASQNMRATIDSLPPPRANRVDSTAPRYSRCRDRRRRSGKPRPLGDFDGDPGRISPHAAEPEPTVQDHLVNQCHHQADSAADRYKPDLVASVRARTERPRNGSCSRRTTTPSPRSSRHWRATSPQCGTTPDQQSGSEP